MADRKDRKDRKSKSLPGEDAPKQARTGPIVVGIGASAGGLAALRTFFDHVPPDSGLAWVVVVHLNPEHESHLADLLQSHVAMPVQQVAGALPLQADHVYVIPPAANLSSVDTHLRLSSLEGKRDLRAPIDHFFRTLANSHDGHAIGVILTGTGSDGALGIKAIKERNGFAVVQEPTEAEYDGMPQSAISTGLVDAVLPLARIPDAVIRFARTEPRVQVPADGEDLQGEQRQLLQKIFAQLQTRTGRDFSHYKRSTLLRRIQRRMQIRQTEELHSYLDRLRDDPQEVQALADDLLITVTNFFRDPGTWSQLEKDVIPTLFEGKGPHEPVRVWSVGCATGEEAYSLAMLLIEEASRRANAPHVQVFASDLHERSLERAREGFYPGDIDTDVTPDRLRRFFHKEDGGYRVKKEVRERVVFAPHNLLRDPPFSRQDLIACRNVMIYLQREVQREVVELFHYALRPDGVLVLGTSETVEGSELFRVESKTNAIFRKRNVRAPEPRLPVFPMTYPRPGGGRHAFEPTGAPLPYGGLHQRIVEQYGPPSMLVSPEGRVVHLSEHAGRYLVMPGGEPTVAAFRLVREELRVELRTLLRAATENKVAHRSKPIYVRFNGETGRVVLDVRPALEPAHEGFALVIFDERPEEEPQAAPAPAERGAEETVREEELEAELEETKQRLQAIIEEYETSQEEMKASTEELQSANEELRSTLEELETSKEELQSMNEELQTVNQENRHKVEELSQLSSDLQNLLTSTEIATLFLDRDLKILRFTRNVGELFNVRSVDRGRPLADLTKRIGYPELEEDARLVLRTLIPVEREVEDEERGKWYLTRVLPYRSGDERIEGIVMTFMDITARLRSEEALRAADERSRLIVESARDYAILTTDTAGLIESWSPGAEAVFGWSAAEAVGQPVDITFTPEDRAAGAPESERQAARRSGAAADVRWHVRKDSARIFIEGTMRALEDGSGGARGFLKIGQDLTQRRQVEEELRQAREELELRVQERTAELARTNDELGAALEERERAEAARRDVMRQLVTAEEDERRRISRELHDQMGQQITGLLLGLRAAQQEAKTPALVQQLTELERLAGGISREVQHLALELRPPALDNLGLTAALEAHLAEWGERHGIEYDFHAQSIEGIPLAPEVETTLYRAVQEGLTNVLKHSGATHVSLILERRDHTISAILEDNGNGFDPDDVQRAPDRTRRLGLRGMRERLALVGGDLEVESSPGSGTTLFVRISEAPPPGAGEEKVT